MQGRSHGGRGHVAGQRSTVKGPCSSVAPSPMAPPVGRREVSCLRVAGATHKNVSSGGGSLMRGLCYPWAAEAIGEGRIQVGQAKSGLHSPCIQGGQAKTTLRSLAPDARRASKECSSAACPFSTVGLRFFFGGGSRPSQKNQLHRGKFPTYGPDFAYACTGVEEYHT